MKSITIHNLEDDLVGRIEHLSMEKGVSQDKLIKALLRKALDLDEAVIYQRKKYYSKIFGTMIEEETKQFFDSTEWFGSDRS